ncbi:Flp pilus assembly protein TadD [Stenotrophomonas sp.]|uniref:Flp pilus assembly protein TadD n=1 Tax=Stenotrophomonas sp. TaxID=69392 RepID=UPI0028AD5DE2|nr:Flp pilus assembly protein TadD [Stenotrophomonas sp.]
MKIGASKAKTVLLIVLFPALLAGCGGKHAAYRQAPVEPALVEAPQDDRGMYLGLLRQMQQQGAYYASLAHIDAFRQRFGDSPELRILQANALRETGDRSTAGNIYRGLTKGAQAAPAWHGLGLIAADARDHDGARLALESAVHADPLNIAYLGDLGFALLQAGQFEQARAPLAKAAELAPENIRAISNLALWAMLSGQHATAESMIQRADLPQSARSEIYRLAQTLRQAAAASNANAVNNTTALAVQPPGSSTQRPRPPGSMLDRFNPTTATLQEATP